MTELVAIDVGGTHARFALARYDAGVPVLGAVVTVNTVDHPTLASAYAHFLTTLDHRPARAALAVACAIDGDLLKLTNNPWTLRQSTLAAELGLDELLVLNDFGAISHAVAHLGAADRVHLCGPDTGLPGEGVIAVVGPGTGLGVGYLLRRAGHAHVIETEGGHVEFAPVDAIEDLLLARLRQRLTRVSVERICSGPGLARIYETLAQHEGRPVQLLDDVALWSAAMSGGNALASAALDRFCLALGTACGNFALAPLSQALVLAGGIPPRILPRLKASGFGARLRAKGRFEAMMAKLPVYVCTHPQPGLLGAAAAFAARRTP